MSPIGTTPFFSHRMPDYTFEGVGLARAGELIRQLRSQAGPA